MNYTGYKMIYPMGAQMPLSNDFYTDTTLSAFYSDPATNWFDCLENQYLVIADKDGKPVGEYKWDGHKYVRLRFKNIDNIFSGRIAPRNVQQRMAFDMLQDDKTTVKVLTGCFGSGKTMLMVVHALDLISKEKFDKLVWVRNNIEVKDTTPLGALPGSAYEKLLPYVGPLADHVGDIEGIEQLIERGQLEVQHLGYIRGRDIKNSIIISTEAENLTKQHVQLLIGRVGEGSNLWIEGDYSQVDKKVFEENSGMKRAVDKLQGNELFGYVNLPQTERSATARLADKLD